MEIGTKKLENMNGAFNRMLVIVLVLWTAVCTGSMAYHVLDSRRHIEHIANETARESIQKDLLYRYWASRHGGVYVPVTEATRPNPYLAHIPERDIATPSGRRLTLMNPAYMTRQVHELAGDFTDAQGHITSLNPIRPENAPDRWEWQALKAIEGGAKEFGALTEFKGVPHYRLLLPLYVEPLCLKCHEAQGYKRGDLRGGISAAIPMSVFASVSKDHLVSEAKHFGIVWLLGLAGIGAATPYVRRRIREQEKAEHTLRRNLEFTRSIIENEPECVKILGPGGELQFMNPAGLAMIDAEGPEQVVGRKVQDLVVPEHRDAFVCLNERVFAGEGGSLEFEIIGLKGTRRWLETHAVPLRDAAGNVESLLGITRDITHRRQSEHALRESEVLYRSLVETTSAVAWEVDVSTMAFTYVSPQIAQLSGYPAEQWTGFAFWVERIHPDDRASAVQYCQAETTKGLDHAFEYRMITANGTIVWVRDVVSVIKEQGTPVALRGYFIDITASKASEDALRKSEEHLREAQHIGKIGSWEWQIVTDLLWWSDEVYAIFGKDPALGITFGAFLERIHPDDRDRVRESINDAVRRSLDAWQIEYRIVLENGGLRYLYESATAAKDGSGAVVQRRGIVQDITERKLAEQQKEHLEQQLLQAQKIESVGRLAGGIAHDINNMLMPILGYTEMLELKVPAKDPLREDLKEISGAAERIRDLTRQLLAFARKQTLEMALIDLNAVVSGFSRMLRMTLREDIAIKMQLASTAGCILGDKGQLEQVILNLAVNAQDALPGGGTFTVATSDMIVDGPFAASRPGLAPGAYVKLTVADTGTGMDVGTLSKIFDPFFTTKEAGRGTGLGLATVYGIVKQHSGYIEVGSEPGGGSEFTIYLPVNKAAACVDEGPLTVLPTGKGVETVLVVEDQEQVLRLVSLMLGDFGYRVLPALSGREALEKTRSFAGEIHLAITDVIMQDMNGKELLEKLREMRPNIKGLYMSGYSADVISSKGVLDSGINFLRKPFSVHELAAKVRQVLDGSGR